MFGGFGRKILEQAARKRREASGETRSLSFAHPCINPEAQITYFSWPFAHVVLDNFLTPSAAKEAAAFISSLLTQKDAQFRYNPLYNLYDRDVQDGETSSLSFLFDLEYKKCIESFFGISLTPHVTPRIHNNTPSKADKYVHSDWVLAAYKEDGAGGRLTNPSSPAWYSYFYDGGRGAPPPEGTHQERRSATAILYLSPDWTPGMGGATRLFSKEGSMQIPAGDIDPLFNRLLLFKNSPEALHNYTACSLPNRNSIIEWFHQKI